MPRIAVVWGEQMRERRHRLPSVGSLRWAALAALFCLGAYIPLSATCYGGEGALVALRSGNPLPHQTSTISLPPSNLPSPSELEALRRRVDERLRYAMNLATRGAVCSARVEFTKAIDLVAMSLDMRDGEATHRRALQAGLQAFQEAADFRPAGTSPAAHGDLAVIVAAHRTPVLKNVDLARVLPTDAMQAYFEYATEQVALAGGHEPAASFGLYSWARVEAMPAAAEERVANKLGEPMAMALHHAALKVDANNYLAANELGVLLARYGRMQEAKQMLQHSASLSRKSEAWYNLSIVHRQLGEQAAAQQAYVNYQAAASKNGEAPPQAPKPASGAIRWVDYETFARDSGPDELSMLATNPRRSASAPAASKIDNPLSFLNSLGKPKATAESAPARASDGADLTEDRTPTGHSSNPRRPSTWPGQRSGSQ